MPSWITLDFLCEKCGHEWDQLTERQLRDELHDCTACGERHGKRTMSVPNINRVSYHDGYRRGSQYEDLKAVAKLEKERAVTHHDKRADIDKEIAKRKKL